jgi:mono/diheme cytochrome c family protein
MTSGPHSLDTPVRKAQIFGLVLVVGLGASFAANGPEAVAVPEGASGVAVYQQLCAECHHPNRVGISAPPLLPDFLRRKSDEDLIKVMKDGLAATQMPAYPDLTEGQLEELVALMRATAEVTWTHGDIEASLMAEPSPPEAPAEVTDLENLTAVVERGTAQVWIMENEEVLDRFPFSNVHGGIKFTTNGKRLYVPSRDGWVGRYDMGKGYYGKVRACVNLRNIALTHDGKHLVVASWLPAALIILDAETLKPVQTIPVEGKISAIYNLFTRKEAVFTLRDKPVLGVLDTTDFSLEWKPLEFPVEDFFIGPFEQVIVGTARRGTVLGAYDLNTMEPVFSSPVEGFPHLFSAAMWYHDGEFFFATAHIDKTYISVWRMYDWSLVKQVDVGGKGFFVRTHPATPYLWVDRGDDQVALVNKRDLSLKTMRPEPGGSVIHTEFSGDGRIAYISLFDAEGALSMYDGATLRKIGVIPASLPVGKYNFINKQRRFDPVKLGQEVFSARCWGCHHPSSMAFGPSLKWISENRSRGEILAQVMAPEHNYRQLGYEDNAMPRIPLGAQELEALVSLIADAGDAED